MMRNRTASSKEELFLLVVEQMLVRVQERARAKADEISNPAEALKTYLEVNMRAVALAGPRFAEDTVAYLPALKLLNEHLYRGRAYIAAVIQDGSEQGTFRGVDAELVSAVIVLVAQQLAEPQAVEPTSRDRSSRIGRATSMSVAVRWDVITGAHSAGPAR